MTENLPKVMINDEESFSTKDPAAQAVFEHANNSGVIPHIRLASGEMNPRDRLRPQVQRVGIYAIDNDYVGAFNLVQGSERSWINDIRIPERRGEKLGIAAYMGTIALLNTAGRRLESDPGGLSEDSVRVWRSLTKRGLAVPVEGQVDQHGHPRFVSAIPIKAPFEISLAEPTK